MKTNELGINIPIQIKTITPLHIGGNEVWSPLADYWLDAQKNIRLVDAEAFAKVLTAKNKAEQYVRFSADSANENKQSALSDFARNNLQTDIKELCSTKSFKSYGIENPTKVDCCIETNDLPYIPGSSIKGAIRTILLLDWLLSASKESDQALNKFLDTLEEWEKKIDWEKREIKGLREIEKSYQENVEEAFFGKLKQNEFEKPKKLPMACLRINDTNTVELSQSAIYQLDRFHLLLAENTKEKISVLKQCIGKNAVLHTNIYLDHYNDKEKNFHSIFKGISSKETFFALVNKISLTILDQEYFIMGNKKINNKLNNYDIFLAELKTTIEKSNNTKGYLRLGFGKMQFYQTIGIALMNLLGYDENDENWKRYLNYCKEFKKEVVGIYPVTRVLTSAGQEPLGWVELS